MPYTGALLPLVTGNFEISGGLLELNGLSGSAGHMAIFDLLVEFGRMKT